MHMPHKPKKFYKTLTFWIFFGMLAGIVAGLLVHNSLFEDLARRQSLAKSVSICSDIFLRLLKMVIAPLVFCQLAGGIAKIGDIGAIGRIGAKAMLWFFMMSIISLFLGMTIMNLFDIGQYIHKPQIGTEVYNGIVTTNSFTFRDFILHIFPKSIVKAMADNEILQVVLFALFFGVAAASIGEKVRSVVQVLYEASHILLKVISYVMYTTPFASFAAMFSIISVQGWGALRSYVLLIITVFSGLAVLWIIICSLGYVFLKKRVFQLIKYCRMAFLLAFSTSSSESAYPLVIRKLREFGCRERMINFILPLGYSFNLDGSMMFLAVASLFIAQVYHVHLDFGTQFAMLFFLLVTSKGIAAVPRATMVIIGSALTAFNLPEAGLALLLGVDAILDMGRSATNVFGNAIATAVMSKIEKEIDEPKSLPSEKPILETAENSHL